MLTTLGDIDPFSLVLCNTQLDKSRELRSFYQANTEHLENWRVFRTLCMSLPESSIGGFDKATLSAPPCLHDNHRLALTAEIIDQPGQVRLQCGQSSVV